MRGHDKLLEKVDGETLLGRQLQVANALGLQVLAALPPEVGPRHRVVLSSGAQPVIVDAPERGLSASIIGLVAEAEKAGADGILLMLADMPEIQPQDLRLVLAEAKKFPGAVVRAGSEEGRPGHPVYFPRRYFSQLGRLRGDRGARDVISSAPQIRVVPLEGKRALLDLDTPEDWAAWRASLPRQ
jgi:molybdenum cofactor cytidylyltransferase